MFRFKNDISYLEIDKAVKDTIINPNIKIKNDKNVDTKKINSHESTFNLKLQIGMQIAKSGRWFLAFDMAMLLLVFYFGIINPVFESKIALIIPLFGIIAVNIIWFLRIVEYKRQNAALRRLLIQMERSLPLMIETTFAVISKKIGRDISSVYVTKWEPIVFTISHIILFAYIIS